MLSRKKKLTDSFFDKEKHTNTFSFSNTMTDIEQNSDDFVTVGPSRKKEKKSQRVEKRDNRFVHNFAHQRGFQDGCTLITSFHQAQEEALDDDHPDRTYELKRYHCLARKLYQLHKDSYQALKQARNVAWENETTKRTDTELFYDNYVSALVSAWMAYATEEDRYSSREEAKTELRQVFEWVMRIRSAEIRRRNEAQQKDQTAAWLVQWNKYLQ